MSDRARYSCAVPASPVPTFASPTDRNFTVPVVVAVLVLVVAAGLAYRAIPRAEATAAITQVVVHPIRIAPRKQPQTGSFRMVDPGPVETDLYIVPTVRIDDHVSVPLFLKDFRVTLTTPDGELHTSAIEQNDLPSVYSAFPEIKPLMAKPMLRETSVPPNQSATGTLLLQFAIPQSVWDQRQSAVLTIDFYHQSSLAIPFPKL